MKKVSLVLILCLLLSFGTSIVASAEEYGINPRYNNLNSVHCNFSIANDIAIATVNVTGFSGVVSRIVVNAKLEKRALLGLIWSDVNEWNVSSYNSSDDFTFTESVSSGTYRCSFEITVEGNGGSADVITDQITVKN